VFGTLLAFAAESFCDAASSIAACTRVRDGFCVVRYGEASTCCVIRSVRVCCVIVDVLLVSCLRARRELVLEAAMAICAYVYEFVVKYDLVQGQR
jgi:hypothetical protein